MAFWETQFRMEPLDKDPPGYRLGQDGVQSDASSDLFGQYMNFDGEGAPPDTALDNERSGNPDSFFMAPAAMHTTSSVVSSADEFEYFATGSSGGVDAAGLAFGAVAADPASGGGTHGGELGYLHLDRRAMSDADLHRLEDISLRSSPQKNASSASPTTTTTTSPTPLSTSGRPKRLVDAISSTIRKATNTLGRRSRKEPPPQQQQQQQQPPIIQRAASPSLEHPPMAIKSRSPRMHSITTQSSMNESQSPLAYDPSSSSAFINGYCDDPFAERPGDFSSPIMQYFHHDGMDDPTPAHASSTTRRIKSEQQLYQGPPSMMASTATVDGASQQGGWRHPMTDPTAPGPWSGGPDYVTSQDSGWWDFSMNASVNQAMHSQHGELPYEYAPLPDASAAGLTIHMPQPRSSQQPGIANDIALTAQTYLPPPPPPPPLPIPGAERSSRPPRAPSSGTRHRNMSSSPMRRTRGPSASASPTQAHSQMRNQSRHSSTGSISSVRSASARGPGSAPNTPGGVRKRRSRDVLGGTFAGGASLGGSGGGGGISLGGGGFGGNDGLGFVNFTPNDGNVLMTGVAPSGSSKTKARREKEAQEKRRKLSEAAMKAVAAAGGDVDKLIQEGFVF